MYPDKPQIGLKETMDKANANSSEMTRADVNLAKSDLPSKTKHDRMDENFREVNTANRTLFDGSTSYLEERAAAGYPTEVSGDALARAKKGQTPKLHRN